MQGSFRIGVVLGGKVHLSDSVELSDEECNSGYMYPMDGLLYLDGHLQMRVDVCHDNILVQVERGSLDSHSCSSFFHSHCC